MDFPTHTPYVQQQGMVLAHAEPGSARIGLVLREEHLNAFGVAHGAVLMGLLDVAMAHAARSVHMDQPGWGPGVVTLELKTSFMQPGEGHLTASARIQHRSATLAWCEGHVHDERGQLCAHATATFKYLRALPGRDRQLRQLGTAPAPQPES